jgi:hypothetical protein
MDLLQHMREKYFWILINKYGMTWSLVFVLKLISTFIGQNKELFFMHVLKKGCSASLCNAHEKKT